MEKYFKQSVFTGFKNDITEVTTVIAKHLEADVSTPEKLKQFVAHWGALSSRHRAIRANHRPERGRRPAEPRPPPQPQLAGSRAGSSSKRGGKMSNRLDRIPEGHGAGGQT